MGRRRRFAGTNASVGLTKMADFLGMLEIGTVVMAGVGRGLELSTVKSLWPMARVIGVDPVPEHIEQLRSDEPKEGFARWLGDPDDLIEAVLSDRCGQVDLWCSYYPDQRASLCKLAELPGEHRLSVSSLTLDDLLSRTGPWVGPVLLWLDAEGSESRIIAGGPAAIRQVAIVNREINLLPLRDGADGPQAIGDMMDLGYVPVMAHSLSKSGTQMDVVFVLPEMAELLRRRQVEKSVARKLAYQARKSAS